MGPKYMCSPNGSIFDPIVCMTQLLVCDSIICVA